MSISILGRRYASALLTLATQAGNVDKVSRDLRDLAGTWAESKELRSVFENPSVTMQARRQVIVEIAKQTGMEPLVRNTLQLISDRHRMGQLPEIIDSFNALAEARSGRVRAEVTTATELPEAYFTELKNILERVTGKSVVITKRVDASLLGGVVTRIGDQVFDGSLSHRLSELKHELSR